MDLDVSILLAQQKMSPEKRQRLSQRLLERSQGASLRPKIKRNKNEERVLSFAQERLWFLWQMDPNSVAQNRPTHFRIHGPLRTGILEHALNEIIRRHEGLRSRFAIRDGRPSIQIAPCQDLELAVTELSHESPGMAEEQLRQLAAGKVRESFDLEQGPLVRAELVRINPDDHVLLLVFHHIVFDAWSGERLTLELAHYYQMLLFGSGHAGEPQAHEYADFAAWQHRMLEQGFWEEDLRYWKLELGGKLPLLQFGPGSDRPRATNGFGYRHSFELNSGLTDRLTVLGRTEKATLFMVLLAAFKVLLFRWTGENDLIVGCPISGRTEMATEPLMGCFINILAMRNLLEEQITFQDWLIKVRDKSLKAFNHQGLPFEKVVDAVKPVRNLNNTPVYQTVFNFRNIPSVSAQAGDLLFAAWDNPECMAEFDLALDVKVMQEGLRCAWIVKDGLFQNLELERMERQFQELLEEVAYSPTKLLAGLGPLECRTGPLGVSPSNPKKDSSGITDSPAVVQPAVSEQSVPLLTPWQREKILVSWNDTTRPFPGHRSIHELFEELATKTPEAIALVSGEKSLTYSQLDLLAHELAVRLLELGAGPGCIVGLCVERSLEVVVGLLATLKAGSAYLALDPEYPDGRLSWMLGDAQPTVLLTQKGLMRRVSTLLEYSSGQGTGSVRAKVLFLDELQPPTATLKRPLPGSAPSSSQDIACVIYTSGSTGKPKGIEITHCGVVRLVRGVDYASFSSNEVFLQLSPLAFDASTLEIWGSLLNGGRLVMMPPGIPSLSDIGNEIRKHEVTTVFMTSGLFHAMVEERIEDLENLHQLLSGGDVLSPAVVRRVKEKLPNCRMVNCYGPTECATIATCHIIPDGDQSSQRSVPIGKPISNTRVYVLNSALDPVQEGVTGELFLGGPGLARGYLHDPELTGQKFIPNPFSDEPGERLYRTGDLARFL
ncbi:MAG: Glutamate-semialdehyde aminotransferase, partial [Verrucomicrobiales bacterium]|nr:Glutamate-semialdehyde aminotransferase [Verrucomicrobiales bacterium]